MMTRRISLYTLLVLSAATVLSAEPTIDELSDLTGGVIPVVSLETPDAFSGELTTLSEVRYLVRVKNQTDDPTALHSLMLVVDHILDNAGRDTRGRIEVQGHDGLTKEGKPYFQIPAGPQLSSPRMPKARWCCFGSTILIFFAFLHPHFESMGYGVLVPPLSKTSCRH